MCARHTSWLERVFSAKSSQKYIRSLMSSHFTNLNSFCEWEQNSLQAEHVFQRVLLAVLSERRTINRPKALASLTISTKLFIQPAIFCLLSGPKLVQTSVPGSLPSSWTNASLKKHPDQIPKPPHQASFQISRTEVLTLSLRLSPETRQSKLAVVGESRNVDWAVNRWLCLHDLLALHANRPGCSSILSLLRSQSIMQRSHWGWCYSGTLSSRINIGCCGSFLILRCEAPSHSQSLGWERKPPAAMIKRSQRCISPPG